MHWNILGHASQLQQLEQDLTTDNLAHAYLFSGSDQIGKFTIAKRFAPIIQCPNQGCNNCPTCLQIEKGHHFDTIQLLDDGASIKIKDLRDTIERVSMSNQGNYTIVLIEKAERMTRESSNCLLKTLEEPPKKTLFILTSHKAEYLLDTIISRARTINFKPQPNEILAKELKTKFPATSPEARQLAINIACGKPGKAIALLEDEEYFTSIKTIQEEINKIFSGNSLAERFRYIKTLSEDKIALNEFLTLFTLTLNRKIRQNPSPQYYKLLESSQKIPKLLNHNTNTRLLLENLMLSI